MSLVKHVHKLVERGVTFTGWRNGKWKTAKLQKLDEESSNQVPNKITQGAVDPTEQAATF